ncbi:MAG: RNA methyltransferase [Longimicrobiales bacterium]
MVSRSESKQIRALGSRKDREAEGRFLAEGVRVVEELLDAGLPVDISVVSPALTGTPRGERLAARLREAGPVREIGVGELNELADTESNQGVLVVAETPRASRDAIPMEGPSTVLVLDGVQDPGNLGTLVRSAAAFGCQAVAYLPGTVDPWNPKAVRAAAGALFRTPVVQAHPDVLMDDLSELGFMTLGADATGRPVDRLTLSERTALVVGNEGGGLSGFTRSRVDSLVAVPMAETVESLNVAVAAGILLYLVTRMSV